MYALIIWTITCHVRVDYFPLFHWGSSLHVERLSPCPYFSTAYRDSWSRHLNSYLFILGENRFNPTYLVQQNLIDNTTKN